MRSGNDGSSWFGRVVAPLRGLFASPAARSPGAYEYQPQIDQISYEKAADLLEARGHRVVRAAVNSESPDTVAAIRARLVEIGVRVEDFRVDVAEFQRYLEQADYTARFPDYYGSRMTEKQLEHFVTMKLLALAPGDAFLDIASEDSPIPDILERLTGATTYWQDIQYPAGINGRRIGGDACAMPLPDGFASAAALTCSIEHFERDADQVLCDELGRILRPGGRLVIAPLYMYTEPAAQTDPVYSAQSDVPFDQGVPIFCARDWKNRHARFYSADSLRDRVLRRLEPNFECTVKFIANPEQIPGHTYLRFVLLATRK